MSRCARRALPALLIVLVCGLFPATTAQARALPRNNSTDVYEPMDFHSFVHHLWTGLLSLLGSEGAGADPNGLRH